MGEAAAGMIVCPSCNKSYRWKSELAGKRVKCKCGTNIDVPQALPDEPDEDHVYDMVDAEPPPAPKPPVMPARPAVAASPKRAATKAAPARGAGSFIAPPTIGPVKMRKQESDASGTKKLIVIGVFAVFFVVGAVLGMKFLGGGGNPTQPTKGNDAKIL